jgi:hypothetical protein
VVELLTPDDVLDKMIYAITNPAKDHLVEKAVHWPGVDALSAITAGVPLTALKPSHFFRPDGDLPDAVTLEFHRPPGLEAWTHAEFASCLRARVAAVEADAAEARRRLKIKVLGRAGVLSQSWRDRPKSREPRRKMSPRLACKNRWCRRPRGSEEN